MEEKKRSYVALYNDMKCELIKEVGLSTAMVYLIIKSHKMIENNMHCCYPSNEELYKECNLKKRQFQNHLTKLVDTGWIVVKSGGTKIGRNSNYYFPREIGMYTEAELNYISKIERRSTKKDNTVEEIPTQDINIPSSVGDDLFDEEIEESPPSNNIDASVGYMEEFYVNMHSYYNVNDESLKTNKTISKKVNDLVGFINTELTNNNIENIKAEKIINDIMKNNQKSFNNALNNKSITDDFKKCTYIISCVQNNFKDKKLKTLISNTNNNKFSSVADDGFVDYMNDNYIALPNGENLTKDEVIKRMKSIIKNEEQFVKDAANSIVNEILKSYKTSFENAPIQAIRDIINRLNKMFKREFLLDERFDGIIISDIAI